MMSWIVLFVMLVVVPAVLIWQVGYKGFVPAGERDAVVVRVDRRVETLVNDSGRRHRTRQVTRWYPVVEYWRDGVGREAEAIVPDYGCRYVPGDRVRIVIGRNPAYCVVKDYAGGDGRVRSA